MFRDNPNNVVFSRCKRHDDEIEVKPNLAYTPAEVAELTAQGKPISIQSLSASDYVEGEVGENFDIDLDLVRGVDINDLWAAEQRGAATRRKFGNVNVKTE